MRRKQNLELKRSSAIIGILSGLSIFVAFGMISVIIENQFFIRMPIYYRCVNFYNVGDHTNHLLG